MLASFPIPDGAKVLATGDSTMDSAFPYQLISAVMEKLRANRNPITSPSAVGSARLPSSGYRGFSFVNVGHSGDKLSDVIAALPAQITKYTPTHHICAAGINDVHTSVPLATSEADFDTYLDLTAGTGKPTLFLLPFFWDALGTEVAAFNAAMTVVATAHPSAANIILVNQYTVLNATVNSVNYTTPDTDKAHPNPAFRAALCTALLPLITT
jgi:lysophospholipase L1-like esterase